MSPYDSKPRYPSLGYGFADTPFGTLLVVMSAVGVVDVLVGDSRARMLDQAHERYAPRLLQPDSGARLAWVRAVAGRFGGSPDDGPFPMDLRYAEQYTGVDEAEGPMGSTSSQ